MRVFLSVGSMLPFDRLVKAVDEWALAHKEHQVFAQIGEGGRPPQACDYAEMLDPGSFRAHFSAADLVVSHAGMGNVMMAAELRRPLVMLARDPDKGEHTNNHQSSTANWLRGKAGIWIASSEHDISVLIENACLKSPVILDPAESRQLLIDAVRNFIIE